MNKKQSQSGSAHLIVIFALVLALVGTLGFVFYQNFVQPKTDSENAVSTNQDSVQSKTDNETTGTLDGDETAIATTAASNEGYLVLEDWGVKFKLPTDLGDNAVTYQKETANNGVYYYISTERVSALGGDCAKFISFVRSEEPLEASVGAPIPAGYVDGYYYGFHSPQSACSELEDEATHADIVYPDLTMLKALLVTVEKK